jgi:hypothetical protein
MLPKNQMWRTTRQPDRFVGDAGFSGMLLLLYFEVPW